MLLLLLLVCVALVLNFLTTFVCFIRFIIWNFLDDFVVVVVVDLIFLEGKIARVSVFGMLRMFSVCCVIVRYVVYKNYM